MELENISQISNFTDDALTQYAQELSVKNNIPLTQTYNALDELRKFNVLSPMILYTYTNESIAIYILRNAAAGKDAEQVEEQTVQVVNETAEQVFKVGDENEFVVLNTDKANHKVLLGFKQLKDDPRITKIGNFVSAVKNMVTAAGEADTAAAGAAAASDKVLLLNYMVREAIGIVKDFTFGNF